MKIGISLFIALIVSHCALADDLKEKIIQTLQLIDPKDCKVSTEVIDEKSLSISIVNSQAIEHVHQFTPHNARYDETDWIESIRRFEGVHRDTYFSKEGLVLEFVSTKNGYLSFTLTDSEAQSSVKCRTFLK